jgi:hypothetical protein
MRSHRSSVDSLGSKIARRGASKFAAASRGREAQVDERHASKVGAIALNEEIARLDIAVGKPGIVEVLQSKPDISSNNQRQVSALCCKERTIEIERITVDP